MLVLVATQRSQGLRAADYNFAHEGEIVWIPFTDCCDPQCGCGRGFGGIDSHRATTTARVADVPGLTIERLYQLIAGSLFEQGWITDPDPGDPMVALVGYEVHQTALNYSRFGVGSIIERDGEMLQLRSVPWTQTSGSSWRDESA